MATSGCDDRKQELATLHRQELDSKLATLASENTQANQRLSDIESQLEASKERLQLQNAQLNEYNASVDAYILQHKMAVGVIAAGLAGANVTLSSDNQYSQQAHDLSGIALVGATIWILANMDEVTEVFNTLNQADAHVKSLKSDIAQTSSAIDQQTAAVQESQQGIAVIAQKTATLQRERDQL